MLRLVTKEPLRRARVIDLNGPRWNLGSVCGYGRESRIGPWEVEGGIQLAGAGFCKRRLRDTVVLPHELELDRVADLGSNLIGIEDSC